MGSDDQCTACVSDLCRCTEIRAADPYERAAANGHRQYGGGRCARGPDRPEEWADNEALVGWLRSCDIGHRVCPPGAEGLTLEDIRGWAWSAPDYHPWGMIRRYGWGEPEPEERLVSDWERYGEMSRRRAGETRWGGVAPSWTFGPDGDPRSAVRDGWHGWVEDSGAMSTIGEHYPTEAEARAAVDEYLRCR